MKAQMSTYADVAKEVKSVSVLFESNTQQWPWFCKILCSGMGLGHHKDLNQSQIYAKQSKRFVLFSGTVISELTEAIVACLGWWEELTFSPETQLPLLVEMHKQIGDGGGGGLNEYPSVQSP